MQISSVNLPWRLWQMLGLLTLKFKQSGISFPNTFVFSWERTLFCVMSTPHWIYAQHLSLSAYNIYISKRRNSEKENETEQNIHLRNTSKKTAVSAAPEGKNSERASLEANNQLSRQKSSPLRLWAAQFPTLALSLISGQLQHKTPSLQMNQAIFDAVSTEPVGEMALQ